MRRTVKHMECFKLLDVEEYIDMIESWKEVQRQMKGSKTEYAVH